MPRKVYKTIDTLRLIRVVKTQPKLYNGTINLNNKKLKGGDYEKKKQMIWDRVGMRVFDDWHKVSEEKRSQRGQLMQHRWKNLWDNFVREHRHRVAGIPNRQGTFPFYLKMMFILPYTMRGRNSNLAHSKTQRSNEEPKKHPIYTRKKSEKTKDEEIRTKRKYTFKTLSVKRELKTKDTLFHKRKAEDKKRKNIVIEQNPRDIVKSTLSVALTRVNLEQDNQSMKRVTRQKTSKNENISLLPEAVPKVTENQEKTHILPMCRARDRKLAMLSPKALSRKKGENIERSRNAISQELSEPQMTKLISEALLRTKLEIEERKNIVISEHQMANILTSVLSHFLKKEKPLHFKKDDDSYSSDKFGNKAFLLSCLPILDSLTVDHCLEVKMKILRDIHEVATKTVEMNRPPSSQSTSNYHSRPHTSDEDDDDEDQEPSSYMTGKLLTVQKKSPASPIGDADSSFGEIISYTTLRKPTNDSKSCEMILNEEEEVEGYLEEMRDMSTDITNALET